MYSIDFPEKTNKAKRWKLIFTNIGIPLIAVTILAAMLIVVFVIPLFTYRCATITSCKQNIKKLKYFNGENNCNLQIVESIPEGLYFPENSPKFMSTYEAWQRLLDIAENTVNIGSFYWTLRGVDVINHTSAAQGENIFQRILSNGVNKRLKIQIAQSIPTSKEPDLDTKLFAESGAADIRSVDFPRLLGNGVLHTKVWIVDNKHFYVGSANMDWRSLTQVKELGVFGENCASLADDVNKIFDVYWYLGLNTSSIPNKWPGELETVYNINNPMSVNYNHSFTMNSYFSSSPPQFSPHGRTNDLDAILNAISSAKHFVHIAVMDYFPLLIYTEQIRYWPYIDDAIRSAAIERKVTIKMLISWWKHSRPAEDNFLQSLQSLSASLKGVNVQIRRFVVPTNEDQSKIPFGRVNHNKYMVTDNTAYIGTSNWSGDYFTDTAGIGLVLREVSEKNKTSKKSRRTILSDLQSVFLRDWESPYASPI